MPIKHAKVSALADDPAALALGEVLPSDWNDDHEDAMPDAFTFTAQTGVVTSSTATSNTVTLSGDVGDLWPVVAYGQGSPTIKINGGTATDGRVPAAVARNGDTLTALMTSSGSALTELIATIQVGGRAVNWSVTTESFNPTDLFSGDTGGWWDPSDISTLFQDTAGTVPCTAAGDPVGRMNDKSGNGNNMLLAAGGSTARPTLNISGGLSWLEFDGTNDNLQALFTFVQPATDVCALRTITWINGDYIYDGGDLATGDRGGLRMQGTTPAVRIYDAGSDVSTNDMTVGVDHVATAIYNGASSKLTIDNGTDATGNPGSADIKGFTLGGFGANPETVNGNIRFYGGVRIGRVLTSGEIASSRTYFGNKAGLSL